MSWWLSRIVVLLLILVEGLFVASEMALVTLREGQVSTLAGNGKRGQRLASLVSNPNRIQSAVQLGVTLLIADVTVVVGVLAPKRLALHRAGGIANAVAPTLDRFARGMRPVIWLLSLSTDVVVRLLGGDPSVNREEITEGELRDLVVGHEALSREERRLIDEVFEAGERQLREIMIPRTEVEFFDAGWLFF